MVSSVVVGTLLRSKSCQRRVEAVNPAVNQHVAYLLLFRPVLSRKSVLANNPISKLPNSFDHLVGPPLAFGRRGCADRKPWLVQNGCNASTSIPNSRPLESVIAYGDPLRRLAIVQVLCPKPNAIAVINFGSRKDSFALESRSS